MEDLSLDISDLDREAIIAMLGQSSSAQKTDKLKVMLKRSLMENHKIHKYLVQLTHIDLKKASMIIFENGGKDYNCIDEMFKKFPRAPLGTLIWILWNEAVPSDLQFELMLQGIRNDSALSNLSQEVDDLTLYEISNDASKIKFRPGVDMRSASKKRTNL